MPLTEVLTQLRNARIAHKAWVARADALVAGIALGKEQAPLLPTDCVFGQWYYGDGQTLRKLPAYALIEEPHEKLHAIYMQIFKLLFDKPKVSSFGRFLGRHKKAKATQRQQAVDLIPILKKVSDTVYTNLELLENQVIFASKKKGLANSVDKILDTNEHFTLPFADQQK